MKIIEKYFPDLSVSQQEQFINLYTLYETWNEKINVISRKDLPNLYERHVLHSLSIAKQFPFEDNTNIVDVGTGGGFPGLPLAIYFPNCQFHLVDSINKKLRVVEGVAQGLGLKNITVEQTRMEKLEDGKYDFVVCRAVAELLTLVRWTKSKVAKYSKHSWKNGLICLKGGDLKEELAKVKNHIKIFELKEMFEEDFFDTKKIVYVH